MPTVQEPTHGGGLRRAAASPRLRVVEDRVRKQAPRYAAGIVHLVGAGPGDPELLTLRAAKLLAEADAIVYDRLVGSGILKLARPAAARIYVGKARGKHTLAQDEINALLVRLAREGRKV